MIRLHVDTSHAQAYLGGLYADQIPYATSRAVNDTAKDAQAAVRVHIEQHFILRRRAFVLGSILIPRFSTKRDDPIRCDVVIGRKAPWLPKFETGQPKVGTALEPVAIPTGNLRSAPSALVPLSMYPKNLRLVPRRSVTGVLGAQRHVTTRGVEQLKGKRRTFVLDPTLHRGVRTWGVWQRVGPKRSDIRLIWVYKHRIPTPRLLPFSQIVETTVEARFQAHFARHFAEAARTAARRPAWQRAA